MTSCVVRLLGGVRAAVASRRPPAGEQSRPSCASAAGSRLPVHPAAGVPAGQGGHSTPIIMQVNQGPVPRGVWGWEEVQACHSCFFLRGGLVAAVALAIAVRLYPCVLATRSRDSVWTSCARFSSRPSPLASFAVAAVSRVRLSPFPSVSVGGFL